jgi:hypothetical protein
MMEDDECSLVVPYRVAMETPWEPCTRQFMFELGWLHREDIQEMVRRYGKTCCWNKPNTTTFVNHWQPRIVSGGCPLSTHEIELKSQSKWQLARMVNCINDPNHNSL